MNLVVYEYSKGNLKWNRTESYVTRVHLQSKFTIYYILYITFVHLDTIHPK